MSPDSGRGAAASARRRSPAAGRAPASASAAAPSAPRASRARSGASTRVPYFSYSGEARARRRRPAPSSRRARASACARPASARPSRRAASPPPRRCPSRSAARRRRRSPTSGRSRRRPCRSLASLGVNARSACWTRLPSWPSTDSGQVGRRLGDEEHADALGADQPHRALDRVDERVGRVVEQQVRLVEEEHELGLVEVARLGQLLEQLARRSHIITVENSCGLSCTAGSSRQEMTPRPSGATRIRSAMSSCGSPKNSFPPPVSSPTSDRSSTPTVAFESPPMPSSSALPSLE